MILIPEIKTVVILVPRTGSGSLYRAVMKTYPDAMLIYRHMEADGVPHGYDRWHKVGVVRNPLARLWSLYKFLQDFGVCSDGNHDPAYIQAMQSSVDMSFSDWLCFNQTAFTNPYDENGGNRFYPKYTVLHSMPENRKSQYFYLRPDLGTEIFQFTRLHEISARLGINMDHHNRTDNSEIPALTADAQEHLLKFFSWDFSEAEEAI